jgi:hypothetical protein
MGRLHLRSISPFHGEILRGCLEVRHDDTVLPSLSPMAPGPALAPCVVVDELPCVGSATPGGTGALNTRSTGETLPKVGSEAIGGAIHDEAPAAPPEQGNESPAIPVEMLTWSI